MEQIRQQLLICQSPMEMLQAIFKLPEGKKLRVICTLWSWWSERNKTNHKKTRLSDDAFQAHVGHAIAEWQEFLGTRTTNQTKPNPRWSAPPREFIKINVDAAYNTGDGGGGWGTIARDSDGAIVLAATGKLLNQSSALQAETEALLQAIRLAELHGMGRVMFETDCLSLQQAVSSSGQDRSES